MPLYYRPDMAHNEVLKVAAAARQSAERGPPRRTRNVTKLAEGTIKRLTDKGFGFIDTGTRTDIFFHMSAVQGCTFEQLQEGQRVSYTEGQGPKGPRAENVRVI